MASPTPPARVAAPRADDLERIDPDRWAWLLPHLRGALLAVDESQVPAVRRLRATPAVRLAGGRPRRDVARLLAQGGPLWAELHRRIVAADDQPPELGWLVAGERPAVVEAPPTPPPAARDHAHEERLRERAQRLQRERDDARRQLEGARARAERAEADRDEVTQTLRRLEERMGELEARLERAGSERDQAVERERRRGAAEVEALRSELGALRRAEDERRAEERRREEAASAATTAPASQRSRAGRAPGRLVPGRPSRLPPGVRPGTREAVEALLHRDRTVFVDGYNLTLTQRGDLPLEQQRQWAIRGLATQVARRGIRPTIVFDSTVAGPGGRQETGRGVTVRFTAEGQTADDEIVFEVEAQEPGRPVLVVTDDRGLRDRLRPYAVDVVGTSEFRWILE